MNRPALSMLVFLFFISGVTSSWGQFTMAKWTFEGVTTTNTGTAPIFSVGSAVADLGVQTSGSSMTGLHASSSTVWSNPSGDGTAKAISSNNWAVNDYYQFQFNTTNFNNLSITWDQTGSATGPRDFKVQYSTNGSTFTDATGPNSAYQLTLDAWTATAANYVQASTRILDLSGVTALNNVASVYIRLVVTTTTSINAGTVAAAGTNRIDNFRVIGNYTGSVTNYYSAPTGNLEILTNWVTGSDGISGTNPPNFSTDGSVFNIQNRTTATIGAAWTLSGITKVVVGDGTNAVNFTIPSGFALSGTIDAIANGTLTISNTTMPSFWNSMNTAGTIAFSGLSAFYIPNSANVTYGNLTLSGTTLADAGNSGKPSIYFKGNLTLVSSSAMNIPGFILVPVGSADQTISGNSSVISLLNFEANSPIAKTGLITLTPNTNITLANNLTLNCSGASNQFSDGGNTITLAGTVSTTGNVNLDGNNAGYNFTGTISTTHALLTTNFRNNSTAQGAIVASLNNLSHTGAGNIVFQSTGATSSTNIIIKGNFTIGSAAGLVIFGTVATTPTFKFGGNYTYSKTTASSKQAGITFEFNGTGTQTITSAVPAGEAFENLTINKSSGSAVLANNISIASSRTLNVTNGTLNIGSNTVTVNGINAVAVASGGTLKGSGTIVGAVSLTGTISPGASPGTINTGALTCNANSTYKFEISNATGVAGTDWDKIVSTGAIDVTASPINVDLTSISISNFVNSNSYTWLIASGTSIVGFNPANFVISTANFAPALAGGTFSVTQTGNDINIVFTPVAGPILISPTSVNITNTTADLGANITSDGGNPITARGTVYKLSPGVTSTDNPLAEGGTSTGIFSHTRSGLSPETFYYYAGYATSNAITNLSPEANFRTLSNPPTSAATVFSATAISSTQINLGWTVATFPGSGATANGYIILRRQDSTDPSSTGVINATAPGSLALPAGTTLTATISSGSSNSYFNTGLTPSTQYNYLVIPFTWDGTNTTTYNYYLPGAPAANATTLLGTPVITSPTIAGITSTSAILGANVTADGGSGLTARGTVYKISTGVTITDNPLAEGGTSTGVYSHTRSPLNPETQYFFKGYATNSNGSGLSSESSFYTFSAPPTTEVTGFSGTPVSTSQINLNWTAATFPGAGATATGYVILRRADSTNPTTTGFLNGSDPASLTFPVGTTLVTTVTSGATISFNDTGLGSPNSQYNYLIVPFTWDNTHAVTYNYYLTNAATTFASTLPNLPTLNAPTATTISESTAVLGATVLSNSGSTLTARGTVYKTSSPVTSTDNPLAEGGTAVGTFSHTRSSLSPQTQYFYAGYATNAGGTGLSNEGNFRTLSNPPTSAATNFTATTFSASQIDLAWTVATFPGSGASAAGYIILRRLDATNPTTTGIVNATAPGALTLPGGTTLATTITSGATSAFSNTGLLSGTQYNYLIIPFTWDGTNASTYNYYLINGATANATTSFLKQTFAADGSAFSTSKWSAQTGTSCDNTGQTNAFTNGSTAYFCTPAGTGTGASITVGGIVATENFTLTGTSGTISNQSNGIVTIDVAPTKTLDLSTQNLSGATGGGYIKNNSGVLATTGNSYSGGFTLNAGTIIVRGTNAMGGGTSNSLTLNGGIVASNANRDLTGKYPGGITIGGNIQFGDVVGLAGNFNLTFSNDMSLGSLTRTLTKGSTGNVIFSGVISGTNGITYAANANSSSGVFTISNTANLYTGTTSVTGGEVEFLGGDGAFGAVPGVLTPNSIIIDGGRLTVNTSATTTLNSNRGIQIGATAGTAISVKTASTILVYNGVIADKPATTGSWAKQGSNTMQLGGVSTYTGSTSVNSGTLQLINGNDRLPTGTTIILGQAASANLGIFNLNGLNQQIAGLSSIVGTNATTGNNTVTSTPAAILTLGGSGTYAYGDGTNTNSGVITGAISVIKSGTGTQTFGDANTYTGTTDVNAGILNINGIQTGTGAVTVASNGTLSGTGTIPGTVSLSGKISPGASPGTINTGAFTFNANSTYKFEISNATGVAGTDWDKLVSSGAIDVTASPINIDLTSISIVNFNNSSSYTWLIASGTSIVGFNTANFNVITTNFAPPLAGGTFSVTQVGNNLVLVFTPLVPPVLISPTAASITNVDAVLGANIISDGGSSLTARGTVYKTSAGVTITDNPLAEGGTSTGIFSHTRNGLNPQTQYYYAGYATNNSGTALSPESNFRTLSNPPIAAATTFTATAFSGTQIDLAWTIAAFPGSGATASGYILLRRQDSTNPTTAGIVNATAPGSLALPVGTTLASTITSGSTNSYSNTGLVPTTQYNYLVVPFTWDGTNDATYNYYLPGAPAANATTLAGIPIVITPTVASISTTSAVLGANVTSDGGTALTARGTVYKTTTGVTITDNPLAEGGTSTGVYSHTRSPLNPETQYFFKGYATNANGSGLSTESSFYTYSAAPTSEVTGFSGTPVSSMQINLGWTAATYPGSGATATGYIILRRSDLTNPSTTGIVNGMDPASLTLPGGTTLVTTVTSGATTTYNNTGLVALTQYNYLIVPFTWDNSHAATYNYYLINPATTNATTLPGAPSLTTPTASAITESTAVLGATITSNNGGTITERGTVYKLSSPVAATDNPLAEGLTAVGTFSHLRTGFAAQTQYFYAGYATNSGGIGLSGEGNFRTLSNPPTSAATNFTATPFSISQIDLAWTVAIFPVSGATANGYVLVRRQDSTNPTTAGIINGTSPFSFVLPVGTSLVTAVASGATTSYSNTGLAAGTQYNYLIVPFTWDGVNNATYNYYLPGAATANATTQFASQTFASDGSALSASKWSGISGTPCDVSGQSNAFTAGSIAYFCTPAGTGTGASITVAGLTATENFTLTSVSGTISNVNSGVVIVDVASGKTLDLSTQGLTSSSTAGYIKNNAGVFATAGNSFQGGFTLNAGTIIARGVNAMGGGLANTLTLNGGIVSSTATRDFTAKYGGGIFINGNVQFGDVGGLNATSNLTFSNNVALGNATRILTRGANGNIIFSGIISGTNGITYTANSNSTTGVFTISNSANTYTGTTSITGGEEVEFSGGDGAFGAIPGVLTPNSIIIDGGRLTVNTNLTTTINSNRGIQIGAAAGTAISVKTGSTILVYNGVIADKPASTGSWSKQGGNTMQLGGVSTYTGSTSINNGTMQLINGNDRLPTGTTLNIGQAASTNLGTFNMNGFNQQVAGLVSTAGTNATASNNTLTSSTSASLTFSGSGTYSYGDGTPSNSGVITGAVSLVKNGTGIQILGDINTYTGTTTINNGVLRIIPNVSNSLPGSIVMNGGTLGTANILPAVIVTFASCDLSDNSNIDLSPTNDHSIKFTVAGTFTSGKTLTIYGWQGTGGGSGTKGKIFFSNSAAGLSAGQLAQIQFNNGSVIIPGTNYPAQILSTGEVVSSTTITANNPPTIVMNVATTTDYLDGGVGVSPVSPYAVSGVIGDPTDPFNTLGIDFTVGDLETAAGSLIVTVVSSSTSVVPNANITLSGTGASRNIKVNPAAVGYSNITVSVSDGALTTNYIINYAASAASVNPSTTRFLTGTSDASTTQTVDANYMLVGDDENQGLRLYNRQNSGLPVNSTDYSTQLGVTPTNPEVDIEGSVQVGNRIYWLGSHSNSANVGAARPNRYRLFATDVTGSGSGTTLSYVGRYDGLRTDLLAWDASNGHGLGANYFGLVASAAVGVIPEAPDGSGFNIEGMTMAPDNTTAYICFRAPISPANNRTKALIVPVTNLTALVSGNPSTGPATFGAPILLDLGGRGIREVKRNASGQYVIIAGPASDGNDFKIYTWTGNAVDVPEPRSADLTALQTGGSIESIVTVPDPLLSTSTLQVLADNGDTQYYGDGIGAKDLPNANHKKFRSEMIDLGCVTEVFNTLNDGDNSLRDVIACVPDGSTITFGPSLIGSTITLTSGEILIDKNITLVGPGLMTDLAISGNNASRIFHVASGKTLTLKNLSLINANAASPNGGALYVQGNLTLQDMLLQNNHEDVTTPKGITINSPGGLINVIGSNVQIKQ